MEYFEKYPKIKLVGDRDNKDLFTLGTEHIYYQEKFDGANFRFTIKNKKIIFGSRTQQLTSDEGEDTNIAKGFSRCVNYIRDRFSTILEEYDEDVYDLLEAGYIFYGECMTKHTLDYNWDIIPPFIGFDVYSITNQKFLDKVDMETMFKILGLPYVESTYLTKSQPIDHDSLMKLIPISKYPPISNPTQLAEGIVIKSNLSNIRAKLVRPEFKEENVKVFGGSKKYASNYADELVASYCTNARIDKAIFFFIDNGMELHMSLIPKVASYVYHDIWNENMKQIIKQKKNLNLKQMYSGIVNRCKHVIEQSIVNNKFQ